MQTQALMGPRAIPIFLLAMACSLGLFSVMYTVIHVSGHGAQKAETLQTIDFVRLRRDSQVESMERRKPRNKAQGPCCHDATPPNPKTPALTLRRCLTS